MKRLTFGLLLLLTPTPTLSAQELPDSIRAMIRAASQVTVYETAVTEVADGEYGETVIELRNGGVFVPRGYVPYIGYGKDALLLVQGRSATLLVDYRELQGRLAVKPRSGGEAGRKMMVSEVRADGKVLRFVDGSLYEVTVGFTDFWDFADVILFDSGRVLKLDSRDEAWVIPLN